MTKEQEIYRNMKKRGRLFKSHGKWGIAYHHLYCAIKEAGYSEETIIWKIIDNMVATGYLRESRGVNGRTKGHCGNYIILKWEV